MKNKFAVMLAGCGVYDGSEIHEAVATLIAINKFGGKYQIFAPDVEQLHVVNHLTGTVEKDERNVLTETARIARGNAKSLSEFNASDFDFLIIPGGFGAMKNLCNWAVAGNNCTTNKDVKFAIKQMRSANKPIGAICIASLLLAVVLGDVEITLGNPDAEMLKAVEYFGAKHFVKGQTEVMVDVENKIYTTPAYMSNTDIAKVAEGIENLVSAMIKR